MKQWLASPVNLALLLAWALVGFYHAALGIQVVIEDYLSPEWLKIVSIWLVKLAFTGAALATLAYAIGIAIAAG